MFGSIERYSKLQRISANVDFRVRRYLNQQCSCINEACSSSTSRSASGAVSPSLLIYGNKSDSVGIAARGCCGVTFFVCRKGKFFFYCSNAFLGVFFFARKKGLMHMMSRVFDRSF